MQKAHSRLSHEVAASERGVLPIDGRGWRGGTSEHQHQSRACSEALVNRMDASRCGRVRRFSQRRAPALVTQRQAAVQASANNHRLRPLASLLPAASTAATGPRATSHSVSARSAAEQGVARALARARRSAVRATKSALRAASERPSQQAHPDHLPLPMQSTACSRRAASCSHAPAACGAAPSLTPPLLQPRHARAAGRRGGATGVGSGGT
eukprot:163817-Chlamydomonas_euryale.AAC.6